MPRPPTADASTALGAPVSAAQGRILAAAYDLFSRQGIRAVGVDAIIARSGVAKMTFYRHFASKDDLVLAFLQRRDELWTRAWLEAEIMRRATSPRRRLLAIFDVFNEWFQRDDFEGCSFINVLLETPDRGHRVHRASVLHLAAIRDLLRRLAEDAGVARPEEFARRWHILMKGSIVAAAEGDRLAAQRARAMGLLLLADAGAGPSARRRPALTSTGQSK